MDQNKKDSKPDECVANGTLTINLPIFDTSNYFAGKAQQITSKVGKIGGLTWQMKVRKVLMRPDRLLNVFLHCNEQVKDRLWLCKVHFKVEIWANGEDNKPFYSNSGQFYGFNSHFWIFPVKINDHLLKKRSIEIKLEIKLDQVQEKSLPTLDTDLVVNMGEGHSETLFINKYAMASLSNYFRNLFFEDWRDRREKDGNHFELNEPEDFDIRAFKAMIYAAMTLGSCWMVLQESNFLDSELAVEIVKQSIKFDSPMLLDCCEQFLIANIDHAQRAMTLLEFADQFNLDLLKRRFGPMLLLGFADQFNLVKLKNHCLEKFNISDFVGFWFEMGKEKENREILFSRLNKATREELLAKLDEKFDSKDYGDRSRMEVLEVADHFNLTKLKQHCLDKLNMLDYMNDPSQSHEIHSRLNKATREHLHVKLRGNAFEVYELVTELPSGVRVNESKEVLLEQFNKLAGALLGEEEEESM